MDIIRSQTILTLVRRQQTCLKHASGRLGLTGFDPDGRKSIVGRPALIGAIEDFPISQLTATAQCNAAGSDPAERESDHLQFFALEDPRELNSGVSFTSLVLLTILTDRLLIGQTSSICKTRPVGTLGHRPNYTRCLLKEISAPNIELVRHVDAILNLTHSEFQHEAASTTLKRTELFQGNLAMIGGPGRDRTDDLFHAMEALSQLRHRPTLWKAFFIYFGDGCLFVKPKSEENRGIPCPK